MKKKIIIGIVIALQLFAIGYFADLQRDKKILERYTTGFRGVVLEKYNPREELPPIFVKLRIKNNALISMCLPSNLIEGYVEVGDSIIKFENSYKCFLKKSNGVIEHFSVGELSIEFLNE